jgi:hypothetical protein
MSENRIEHGHRLCQRISGESIDTAIGELVVQTMTPMALDVALAVQQEIQTRMEEVDRLRRKHVERARYEADLSQRRYMLVDPTNRLVADALEADWNSKLRALNEAQNEYERLRDADHNVIDETQRARIASLVRDFPRLWQDPKTPDREKKRMVRLLLEDVTLLKWEQILGTSALKALLSTRFHCRCRCQHHYSERRTKVSSPQSIICSTAIRMWKSLQY